MVSQIPQKNIPLQGYSADIRDITRIFERLLPVIEDQASYEIAKLQKPVDMDQQQWEARIAEERQQAFRCTVTIAGVDGTSLYGDSVDVFTSPNRPQNIQSVYMTNVSAYQTVANKKPLNSFILFLDFSKPPLLDSQNFVSAPTPNESNLSAQGDRDAWIAGVEIAVFGVLKERENGRRWLHKDFVYDFFLLFFALPFCFWFSWRLSPLIAKYFFDINQIVVSAVYLYIFLFLLMIYRVLFGYSKWAFPITEYLFEKSSTGRHRRFWYAIIMALFATFLYDVLA